MFFPISNSHISPLYLVVVGFLIGVMGGIMGLPMPPGFGVAPSTLKHQVESAKTSA